VLRGDRRDWLLRHIGAHGGFTLLAREVTPVPMPGITTLVLTDTPRPGTLLDHSGLAAARYGLSPGECVLLRPDQHVAARFTTAAPEPILAARDKALGRGALAR
jgi:3-(3-hydroxy-phenyl)propionate hydroxylase